MVEIEVFSDRGALANSTALALRDALADGGTLVAAGGSTPKTAYERLGHADINWASVTVTLGDERWVDADAPESNARMVRETLLRAHASTAQFLPLKTGGPSAAADAAAVEPELRRLAPFAAVLLGMGEDGHVASLFPGNPAPDPRRWCIGVAMSGLAPFVPRITLTPKALLATRALILQITGDAKRSVVERILAGQGDALPASGILRQSDTPVRVLWAP